MDIKPILSDIQNTVSLYGELLLCIVAAAVLGFVVGRMISRSTYRKNLQSINSIWESRYSILEDSSRQDTEALEDQLHTMGRENKALKANHEALKNSLTKNDVNVQQARAETIELNRQQAETHARLQRVIQQKDLEIIRLGNKLSGQASTASNSWNKNKAASESISLDKDNDEDGDQDLNNADTIAIMPAQNDLDATIQLSDEARELLARRRGLDQSDYRDMPADGALDSTGQSQDDGTVAFDSESTAYARRLNRSEPGD